MTLEFLVDRNKIEETLKNAQVLIDNGIDPYYSLDCFRTMGYNLENCFEGCQYANVCLACNLMDDYIMVKVEKETETSDEQRKKD